MTEVQTPLPENNEVLIKVHAVSLNDWDYGKLDGYSFLNRLLSGISRPKHTILGSDIAGTVEAVGRDVQKFKPGDEVFGDLSGKWGGFAGYVCASENSLALKPACMSFEQAAAIPQAAMLAVQGLKDKGKIQQGQQILLNGAGGGVGTFALQIAKLYDAEITAVDSGDKLDLLRTMGAHHVIDYKKEDFTKSGKQYDLILDVKTNRSAFAYARALKPNGIYATVGGSLSRLFQFLFAAPWISITTKKRISIVALKTNKDLAYMSELFEAGKVKPVIDEHRFQLKDVPEAFRLFERAAHKGKIVISVAD